MGLLDVVDYQDSYVVIGSPGLRAGRSADALAALAFGSVPRLRGVVAALQRCVLRLRLDASSSAPLSGWKRLRDEPDEAVYGVDGTLLVLRLVVSATAAKIQVSTLVRFDKPAGRLLWAVAGPVHRVVARVVLHRGIDAARRENTRPA
ncbi:hypothetical protein ALI144C_22955 [Actinosynnema sp. ALI-1.44]|nr:hypothetical protein ALI144C_22955 [Actinosynnema sp. ALI-1.44]